MPSQAYEPMRVSVQPRDFEISSLPVPPPLTISSGSPAAAVRAFTSSRKGRARSLLG